MRIHLQVQARIGHLRSGSHFDVCVNANLGQCIVRIFENLLRVVCLRTRIDTTTLTVGILRDACIVIAVPENIVHEQISCIGHIVDDGPRVFLNGIRWNIGRHQIVRLRHHFIEQNTKGTCIFGMITSLSRKSECHRLDRIERIVIERVRIHNECRIILRRRCIAR